MSRCPHLVLKSEVFQHRCLEICRGVAGLQIIGDTMVRPLATIGHIKMKLDIPASSHILLAVSLPNNFDATLIV